MVRKKSKKERSKKRKNTIKNASSKLEISKNSLKPNKAELQILKHNIEAILFAAGKSLELSFIAKLCGSSEYVSKKQLNLLKEEYSEKSSVLMIMAQDTTWKMTVREQYLDVVRKIVADTELSKAVLETLSMIAYRNPALQSEVVKARGTNTYDHIAELVRLGFVIKEALGRSYVLKLSEKFYEYFEIDGQKIKEVFQPVKDRIDEQLLLGNMKIVDMNLTNVDKKNIFENKDKISEEERLGNLEVVRLENQKNAENINSMRKTHVGFLENMDKKISQISDRTSEEEKEINEIKNSEVQKGVDSMNENDVSNELESAHNISSNSDYSYDSENIQKKDDGADKEEQNNSEEKKLITEDEILSDAEKEVKKVQDLVSKDDSE